MIKKYSINYDIDNVAVIDDADNGDEVDNVNNIDNVDDCEEIGTMIIMKHRGSFMYLLNL